MGIFFYGEHIMFIIYHPRAYARHFARELRVSTLYPNHNKVVQRRKQLNVDVNWGCGPRILEQARPVHGNDKQFLNADISGSVLKIKTFELLAAAGVPIPRITLDATAALPDDRRPFYERGKYLGRKDGLSGGAGIVVYEKGTPPAEQHNFYSQVVSKVHEMRIHVAGGNVICEQMKYIPAGSNVLIRNYDNGARFSARNLDPIIGADIAGQARQIAVNAVAACGLDFAAVDLAVTRNGAVIVFELNSAPGLTLREDAEVAHDMPSTYDAYRTYFQSFLV